MTTITATTATLENCQALPSAARRWHRADMLCASRASTRVEFHGELRPVCRMHEASYVRWGEGAEARATELWDWVAPLGPSRWMWPIRRLVSVTAISRSCRPDGGEAWRLSPGEVPP